jgi:hypothetical protein
MWLLYVIIFGLLYLFNAVFSFLPSEITKKRTIKLIGIIVALVLVGQFLYTEIINYNNYSYAQISEDGEIIESRNFDYEVKKINVGNLPQYIIVGKHNLDNLTINTNKAVSPELSIMRDGVLIKFVGVGYGNPIVASDFKIEIIKK